MYVWRYSYTKHYGEHMETQLRIYRIREVCEVTGLKPSTIYKLIRGQQFPQGIRLTQRSTGWPSKSVENWLQDRINGGKK